MKSKQPLIWSTVLGILLTVSASFASESLTPKDLWHKACQGEQLTAAEKAELQPYLAEFEDHGHGTIDNVGGPDTYGYYFVDNQGSDTTTYSWIELRNDPFATWVEFTSADDATENVPLSFEFPFYGALYSDVYVCTNGFLSFADDRTSSMNQCLPASALDGPAICAFWDDLHLHHGGNQQNDNTVVWRDYGSFIVIQYDNIGHYGFPSQPDDNFTFEILLYANGSIKLQYQECNYSEFENSQTIGIQQNNGGTSLEYTCNGGSPDNGRAVWFYRGGYGTLMGHVTSNGQPVYQASVSIEGTDLSMSTDGNGMFYFATAPIGTYTVRASCFGYSNAQHSVTINTNQMATQDLSLTSYAIHNFEWDHTPLAIPDRDTVYAELYVDDNFDLNGVAVEITQLTHTYVGDLIMWLESPWGEEVLLSNRNGGSGDNIWYCQLDDQAVIPIANGSAPFSNRFLPEEELAVLNGHQSRGTWKLGLFDAANQDQGTLVDWRLRVTGAEVPEGWVHGYVTDSENDPIYGAVVTFEPTGASTTTNVNGHYGMWIPVGLWSLDYTATGYCGQTSSTFLVNNNAEVVYDVMLGSPNGVPSQTIVTQEVTVEGVYTAEIVLQSTGSCAWEYTANVNAGEWLTVSPMSATIESGWSELLTLTFNTVGLPAGLYAGEIELTHNGPGGTRVIFVVLDMATSANEPISLPNEFALHGNYPNPFNGQTEIAFDLPTASPVNLTVHNLLGQEVATIVNETRPAGVHHVKWIAQSSGGAPLSSGLYFLRMTAGEHVFVSKLILAR